MDKDQIEKKLGCSIEKHLEKLNERQAAAATLKTEADFNGPSFPSLNCEELDFITEYIKKMKNND